MVFIDELSNILWKFFIHSDLNIVIGQRQYYNAYIGHQINKIRSESRDRLTEMY